MVPSFGFIRNPIGQDLRNDFDLPCDAKVKLPPTTLSAYPVLGSGPFTLPDQRETGAVHHQMQPEMPGLGAQLRSNCGPTPLTHLLPRPVTR